MVEARMESAIGRGGGENDQFPVGMRVLAVDDDPTCLLVLEALLRRCRYHVTTTNQATMALKMLRENRDKFDLVISDVHMPDMDGFKLLELVGLEMDLPVIMLSVNGETKTVMKGITHGACDYLLKPVRLEELKNIWQHVVRRKFSHRDYGNFENREDSTSHQTFNNDSGHSVNTSELPNQNENLSRKRKDRSMEDDNDFEETVHENEDPNVHKKPRVVWSIDLHRKFVAAVNQLGIDKAVPKRILELMNVEKITRENVASHLQKYRLYLKRLSAVVSQQANMVAAFGGREPSHLHMGSLDGFLNLHTLAASGQIPCFTSLQPSGVLGRANTSDMRLYGHNSSEIVGFGHMNSTSTPTNDLIRSERVNLPGNLHGNLLEGIATSLELEHLQPKGIQEANTQFCGGFSGNGLATGNPHSSFVGMTSNALISQTLQQQAHSRGLVNHSLTQAPPVSSDSFQVNAGNPSQFSDIARCNPTWQCALPLTGYGTNTTSVSSLTNYDYLAKSTNNFPISQRNDRYQNISSASLVGSTQQDPFIAVDGQSQSCSSNDQTMVIPVKTDEETKFIKFSSSDNSKQRLEQRENLMNEHDVMFNSLSSSSMPNILLFDPVSGNQRISNGHDSRRMMDKTISSHTHANLILPLNHNAEKSNYDSLLKDKYTIHTAKMQGGVSGRSLDDLVNSVIKTERDDTSFADCDSGIDFYTLGACL